MKESLLDDYDIRIDDFQYIPPISFLVEGKELSQVELLKQRLGLTPQVCYKVYNY